MKNAIYVALMLFSINISAQIKIIDKETRLPIDGVALKSNEKGVNTSSNGIADLNSFASGDTIKIMHPSYITLIVVYDKIKDKKQIELNSHIYSLNEIVFSANKKEEKVKEIPYQVEVIKTSQIEMNNTQTSADMLANTGKVFVQKSQAGGGSPIIRGFEANKVLIVVDGIRMNNAIYRGGHLQDIITLDPNMLERTEILFGPSSTVYGSDALGGVMHFYTKDASLAGADEKQKIKVNSMLRYSSANSEKTAHLDFNIGFKKIAFMTNATFSDFGDVQAGSNFLAGFDTTWKRTQYVERINDYDSIFDNKNHYVQKFSGYKQMDIMEKIKFQPNEKMAHVLNLQYSTSSNIPRYDRLTDVSGGKLRFAEWNYGPQKRMLAAYHLNLLKRTAIYDKMDVTLSYQSIEQSRISRRRGNVSRKTQVENVDVYSVNVDAVKPYFEKYEIRYGVEFTYNNVISKANFTDITTNVNTVADTRYPDGGSNWMSSSIYFTHVSKINKQISFVDGLRYTYVSSQGKWVDTTVSTVRFPFKEVKNKNGALTGNAGFVFTSEKGDKASIIGSTGFRAPNVDDYGKVFDSGNGILIVPNPNLKPEYAWNLEANLNKEIVQNTRLDLSVYYTYLNNALVQKDFMYNGNDSAMYNGTLTRVQAMQNAAYAYIYGFNAGLYSEFNSHFAFRTVAAYTYGRSIDKTTNKISPMDHIPPFYGQTEFLFNSKFVDANFFVRYNGAKRSADYSPSGEDNAQYSADKINGYMPAWFTLNLRMEFLIYKGLRLNLACENITDNHYRVFASGISAPGRNYIVSLRYKF